MSGMGRCDASWAFDFVDQGNHGKTLIRTELQNAQLIKNKVVKS